MNQIISNHRTFTIAPSARGFGYAVMEGQAILECGNKGVRGDKNVHSLFKIEKLMKLFQPAFLVLQDVNAEGCRRAPRIKALHHQIIGLAEKRKCKATLVSTRRLRIALLGDAKGTKHEMAKALAQRFPAELAEKLPPKRRPWENEDRRMDIFDAVALAIVSRTTRERAKEAGIV